MAATFRYSQWDGTQAIFPLNEDALMDKLSDQLLSHGDVTSALRNILRRGLEDSGGKTRGVQDLLEELRSRKQGSFVRQRSCWYRSVRLGFF